MMSSENFGGRSDQRGSALTNLSYIGPMYDQTRRRTG